MGMRRVRMRRKRERVRLSGGGRVIDSVVI